MKEATYIKINAVYQKLKKVEMEKCNIYVHASVATGKTMAVQYYYRDSSCLWMSGKKGRLCQMPELNAIKEDTIIIDDISFITDTATQKYIARLVRQNEKHVVLIGRSRVPSWLMHAYMKGRLLQADEGDLRMNRTHIQRLLKQHNYNCSEKEADQILSDTFGYVHEIRMLIPNILREGCYNKAALEDTRLACFRYYDDVFFDQYEQDMWQLFLSVAEYDHFDVAFATFVTANQKVPALLEYACNTGDFLVRDREGAYCLKPELKEYLLWKRSVTWNAAEKRRIHKRAAFYYERNDDISAALAECEKIPDAKKIVKLLIKNARKHPGTGHYYETRSYYLSLPKSVIEENPVLMAGISMLYSLMLQPDQSERWYQKLRDFEKAHSGDVKIGKEARSRIAYLDIALPHRGVKKVTEILKQVARLCIGRSIAIPEFSVTSNIPSIMNGGKDFCDWSLRDRELAKVLGKPAEIVLKGYGVGLVDLALAESFFEKSEIDDYEIMTLINKGYFKAEVKGKIEMCFAACGLMVKMHLWHDQIRAAENQLADFRKRVQQEKAVQLLPNMDALKNWLSLQKGDHDSVRDWMKNAPNEMQGFYILDRYQYLMKVRSYILLSDYDSAWMLSERLDFYLTHYERNYMWIENTLLRGIIAYRLGRIQWKEMFTAAYEKAESYHFARVIAQEGIAVLPLLTLWGKEQHLERAKIGVDQKPEEPQKKLRSGARKSKKGYDADFFQFVYQKAETMAFQYPNYLAKESILAEPLSEAEKRILHLHSSGLSTKDILALCQITESTLKFHNSNIYRKLGVKSKSDALLAAQQLGLVE